MIETHILANTNQSICHTICIVIKENGCEQKTLFHHHNRIFRRHIPGSTWIYNIFILKPNTIFAFEHIIILKSTTRLEPSLSSQRHIVHTKNTIGLSPMRRRHDVASHRIIQHITTTHDFGINICSTPSHTVCDAYTHRAPQHAWNMNECVLWECCVCVYDLRYVWRQRDDRAVNLPRELSRLL